MKRCPTCGTDKPETDFHRDRTRPDGLRWECKQCVKEKRQQPREQAVRERMASDTEFNAALSPHLKAYIDRQVKRYGRGNPDVQDDLTQEAWIAVATADTGEDLLKVAHRAVERVYRRDYERLRQEATVDDITELHAVLLRKATGQAERKPGSDAANGLRHKFQRSKGGTEDEKL